MLIVIHTLCYLWPDSSGVLFRVDMNLQPCKTMTNICVLAPVEHAIWMLSAWNSILDHNDVPSA